MAKLSVDQALLKAKSFVREGEFEKAQKLYLAILQTFPKHRRAQQGLAALNKSKQSVTTQGPPLETINQLANLYNQGQLTKVELQAQALTEQYPDAFFIWNILGAAQKGLGKTFEASEAFRNVTKLIPDNADGYRNLGVTLEEQGKLEEAIEAHNKALSIKPDYAEVYYSMGITFKKKGKLEEAIAFYKKALSLKPSYAEAYNNMGVILQDQGKLDEAITSYNKALSLKPDYADAYYNMGHALKGIAFTKPNLGLQNNIISLLDKKSFVRPNEIAEAVISLLKTEPTLKRILRTFSMTEVEPKLHKIITDLSDLPLLLKLMSVCPIPDLELENLFRELRKSLLLSLSDLPSSPKELAVQSALALHCFTNEYIFITSEHEDEALLALDVEVKHALDNGNQPRQKSLLCLASYRPLNEYEWSSSLLLTDGIEDVFTRQVVEPNQEISLKAVLPVLNDISDKVSSKVRDQYEVSPYPRWVNTKLRLKPAPISKLVEEMNLKLFDFQIKGLKAPRILIAGCGTGQQSISTAASFKNSKVLAIDLSLSSLSYAKRKTEELGIQNIDYMQADILDLGKLNKQYDILESCGVLHHMDDPFAGWRMLTGCLKPGGLMKIGLYSELARQHIVEIRREISKGSIRSNDTAMKSFRAMVMTSNQNQHKQILDFSDFYSLSELKDLLFHVQEHRFTIPQIRDYLFELGLKFCGFEADKTVQHFKLTNTNRGDPYNLDKWHTYEEDNPSAFAAMYQFWCQKIA